MTGQEDGPDGVELPRFVRRIGVLGEAGPPSERGAGVGVLAPFGGVLDLGLAPSGRIPPALTYLTLADLVARGLGSGREPRGHRGTPGQPAGPGEREPASDRSSSTPADEAELKVYHLLRGEAGGDSGPEAGRPADRAPEEVSDPTDAGRPAATERSTGGQPGRDEPTGRDGRAAPPRDRSIRDLRRLGPGGGPAGSDGSLRVLERPRTVLATGDVPTRRVATGAPTERSRSPADRTPEEQAGARADEPGDWGRPAGPGADRAAGASGFAGSTLSPSAWTAAGEDPPAVADREEKGPTGRHAPGDGSPAEAVPDALRSVAETPVAEPGPSGPPSMDVVGPLGVDAAPRGADAGTRGAGRGFATSGSPTTGTPGEVDRRGGGRVPLTVVEGRASTDDREGPGAATGSGVRGRDPSGVPGGADAPGAEDGTAPAAATGAREGDAWQFPRDLSLEGGGPDARFIEELYRELSKKMRIERDRRGF